MAWIWRQQRPEAEIRHVFGDTPITEASIGAAPPDILVKLSGSKSLLVIGSKSGMSSLISTIWRTIMNG